MLLVLSELMDSNDQKAARGKTMSCIKRRSISGHFNNIIYELIIETFWETFPVT